MKRIHRRLRKRDFRFVVVPMASTSRVILHRRKTTVTTHLPCGYLDYLKPFLTLLNPSLL
jgi:hypothetical protein